MKSTTIAPSSSRRTFGVGLVEPEPMVLEIKGRFYAARPLPGAEGVEVVRVHAMDDVEAVYDVSRGPDGLVACTCPDYLYRHENTAGTCKHGHSVVAAGLLEAPAPVANPSADDAESDPADWPAWTDDDVWVADEPADVEPAPVVKSEIISDFDGIRAAAFAARVRLGFLLATAGKLANRAAECPELAEFLGGQARLIGEDIEAIRPLVDLILGDAPQPRAKGLDSVEAPAPSVVIIPTPAPAPTTTPADDSCPCWTDPKFVATSSYCPSCEAEGAGTARPTTTTPVEPVPTFRGVNRIARFMPSAVDVAYESGRTVGIEAESFVEPPADYTLAERAGWFQGMASALIALDAEWNGRAERAGF